MNYRERCKKLDFVPTDSEKAEDVLTEFIGEDGWHLDVKIGERWYPVRFQHVNVKYGEQYESRGSSRQDSMIFVVPEEIIDAGNTYQRAARVACGYQAKQTVRAMIESQDMRVHDPRNDDQYVLLQKAAAEVALKVGAVAQIKGMLSRVQYSPWSGPAVVGRTVREDREERVIIDPSFESAEGNDGWARNNLYLPNANFFPRIRVFSLSEKRYGSIDIRDVSEPNWQPESLDSLVLPDETMMLVKRLLQADLTNLPCDILERKHGGVVILASGPSGVGKTLTAEVISEHYKRPLYSVDIVEIGSDPSEIETNLDRIFDRAERWKAVLMIDEVDLFMRRRGVEIQHNFVVGSFLRKLDYFHGILFMTTNMSNTVDPAFASRVTICLEYSDLSHDQQNRIFEDQARRAKLVVDGSANELFGKYVHVNGREIRNIVRAAKVLWPDQAVSAADLDVVFKHRVGVTGAADDASA